MLGLAFWHFVYGRSGRTGSCAVVERNSLLRLRATCDLQHMVKIIFISSRLQRIVSSFRAIVEGSKGLFPVSVRFQALLFSEVYPTNSKYFAEDPRIVLPPYHPFVRTSLVRFVSQRRFLNYSPKFKRRGIRRTLK